VKARNAASKVDRKNSAKILQQKKREEILSVNRLFNGKSGVPKVVVSHFFKKYIERYCTSIQF